MGNTITAVYQCLSAISVNGSKSFIFLYYKKPASRLAFRSWELPFLHAHSSCGCICLPSMAESSVAGILEKSATREAGFPWGSS